MTRFRHLRRVRRLRISRMMAGLAAPAIALSMVQPAGAAPLPEPAVGSSVESRNGDGLPDTAADSSDEVTKVEEFTASVDGDRVLVSGRAAFIDVPVMVGQDPVGDGVDVGVLVVVGDTAAVAEALGGDLTAATIARPDPFADTLTFTIDLANPPAVAHEPTPVTYRWSISLVGAPPHPGDPTSPRHYELEGARSGHLADPGSLDPTFRLILGSYITGIGLFGSSFERYVTGMQTLADLQGSVTADTIQWYVPFDLIEAEAGSIIRPYGVAICSCVGLLGGPQHPVDIMMGELSPGPEGSGVARYTIPDPTVQIGIAPAGTPVGDVALTTNAGVESPGTFAGNVMTPLEPGDHILVARACYGDDNCDTATTNVTVP